MTPVVAECYRQLCGLRRLGGIMQLVQSRPDEMRRCAQVAAYAATLAKQAGWMRPMISQRIIRGALLHNMGSVFFPRLRPEERPLNEVLLLDGCGLQDEGLKQILLQQWENDLGTGIPYGLPGAYIYPPARVVALARELYLQSATMSEAALVQEASRHPWLRPLTVNAQVPPLVLVEDNIELRALTAQLMERQGVEVRQASNGREALGLWRERPDCVFLSDVRMPGMSGTQLLRQLRELGARNIFAFFTGELARTEASSVARLGVFEYLEKGSSGELVETVQAAQAYAVLTAGPSGPAESGTISS